MINEYSSNVKHIQHIFFDLDHTLWDFDKNSEKAFEIIFGTLLPTLPVQDFVRVYAPINQACWSLYQNNLISHQELRFKRLFDSFQALSLEVTDALIDQISDAYIEHLPNSNHLFEGCIETLTYLHQKYTLHIITNGFAEVQFKKMDNAQLTHFFDTITHSEGAGVKKPHKGIFEYALQQAKAPKESSIMIGDSLEADVMGAINFGMDAIFFNPNQQEVSQEVKQIANLVALKQIF